MSDSKYYDDEDPSHTVPVDVCLIHLMKPVNVTGIPSLDQGDVEIGKGDTVYSVGFGLTNLTEDGSCDEMTDISEPRLLTGVLSDISQEVLSLVKDDNPQLNCPGDSGSPLFIKRGAENIAVGISSIAKFEHLVLEDENCLTVDISIIVAILVLVVVLCYFFPNIRCFDAFATRAANSKCCVNYCFVRLSIPLLFGGFLFFGWFMLLGPCGFAQFLKIPLTAEVTRLAPHSEFLRCD
eukprot:713383_1